MAISYSFDNLPEMADFFEHLAQRKRQEAAQVRTARDRSAATAAATELEYVVQVFRSSNLFGARFLLLDDDLALAAEEVARALKNVEGVVGELNGTAVMLARRARELRGEESGVPSTHPTFEGGDAD